MTSHLSPHYTSLRESSRGSSLLSRLWTNHPQYFSSLVFMAVPYQLPLPLDLDAINDQTLQFFGYPIFGYWYFFNESSAADAIAQRVGVSMTSVV